MTPEHQEGATTTEYRRGQALGRSWIADGGSPDAPGPDDMPEDFYNGFIDTLSEERRRLQAGGAPVKVPEKKGMKHGR